ncbi:hypothetical protein BM523_14625 [Alteromonas mediterranea]|uniref:DUF6314 family protein n=1 Tax=Alteromonas mediterranea TaxID=314275 RepID=UPI000903BF5A|nr:DUF6314 family protein [Alteromonas mediterranea]APD95140.1 hypothetical protein BM523_14625 [Alteromonas mediterranea]APD98776.1 hypothetical protein BM525_14705 [Alteromonas mediterranea]
MIENLPYTLGDFAGRWTLSRKIIQRNGDVFSFSGQAEFSWLEGTGYIGEGYVGKGHISKDDISKKHKDNGGAHKETATLVYYEKGEVTAPNGSVMPAERRYFWQQPQTGLFEVLFDDERYFHTFSASNPNAEHLCGDDNYVVRYDFTKWPVWRSTWQVKGPRKDYTMISEYSPA